MPIIILILAVAAAALFFIRRILRDAQERENALIARVRTTALYRQLYPLLEPLQDSCVEQVLIRQEEITIRFYRPMNRVVHFNFAAHGLDDVDQPVTLRALSRALAVDVPALDDPDKFWFTRKSSKRDMGPAYVWYEYNVQPDYKDVMLRAWYDRPEPEEGVVR